MVFLLERAKLVVEGAGAVGVAALLGRAAGRLARRGRRSWSCRAGTSTPGCSPRWRVGTRAKPGGGSCCWPAARPARLAGAAAGAGRRAPREPARRPAHPRGVRPARARDRGPAGARDARPRPRAAGLRRRPPGGLRRAATRCGRRASGPFRASSTSAPTMRLRSSASGCHCTPSTNRRRGRLDRLGQVVERRVPGDLEPFADRRDPLVVVGLGGVELLAGRARGERAGGQTDVVVGALEAARPAPVLLVTELLGQVLARACRRRRR